MKWSNEAAKHEEIWFERIKEIHKQLEKEVANNLVKLATDENGVLSQKVRANAILFNEEKAKKMMVEAGKGLMAKTMFHFGKRALIELKKEAWADNFVDYIIKGGPGSGNFGHAGRPGEVGGSGPGGEGGGKEFRTIDSFILRERSVYSNARDTVYDILSDLPENLRAKVSLKSGAYSKAPNALGLYDVNSKKVTIFHANELNDTSMQIAILHEVGHSVFYNKLPKDFRDSFQSLIYKQKPITKYAGEAMSLYKKMPTSDRKKWLNLGASESFAEAFYLKYSGSNKYKGFSKTAAGKMFEETVARVSKSAFLYSPSLFKEAFEKVAILLDDNWEVVDDRSDSVFQVEFALLPDGDYTKIISVIPGMEHFVFSNIEKGGPGSGNFGHAGRPGEVGGSSSEGGLYHGTVGMAAKSIISNGLLVSRSAFENKIFASPDIRLALSYATTRTLNAIDSSVPINKRDVALVYVKSSYFIQTQSPYSDVRLEWTSSSDIPPADIEKIELYKYTDLVEKGKLGDKLVANIPKPYKTIRSKRGISKYSLLIVPLSWDDLTKLKKGGSGSGNFGHEGNSPNVGGSGGGNKETTERVMRARQSYKPATKEVQDIGENNEKIFADVVGGKHQPDNEAFDVVIGRHAVEVKTIVRGKNPKITMHLESLARKEKEARKNKLKTHTVVFEHSSGKVFYAKGLGSFRLGGMREVKMEELKGIFA